MLGIVRIALRRPYTFVVVALLILLVGTLAALRMPVDILAKLEKGPDRFVAILHAIGTPAPHFMAWLTIFV